MSVFSKWHGHHIRRIHLNADTLNYYQHDYPNPGYLITPAGYLILIPTDNDHFYTARAAYFKEAVTEIGPSAATISADNKAKVKVGRQALATPATTTSEEYT